jgi:hypothetical protein
MDMNSRRAVTVILLIFVAASVVYLLATELSGQKSTATDSDAADAVEKTPAHQVIAYYFHGYKRCHTCLSIEAAAKQVIETAYPAQLKNGSLVWKAVNFEAPENAHFADDFQLVTSSLVLVEYRNGEQVQWTNLEDVWELIGADERFSEYVRGGVDELLNDI